MSKERQNVTYFPSEMIAPLLLLGLLAGSASAQGGCISYAANCTSSSMCCFSPAIMCLPDIRNGTSCLSPMDIFNLSPFITGLGMLLPGNASGIVKEVVTFNGTPIYNATELVGQSSTAVYGTVGPSAGSALPTGYSAMTSPASPAVVG